MLFAVLWHNTKNAYVSNSIGHFPNSIWIPSSSVIELAKNNPNWAYSKGTLIRISKLRPKNFMTTFVTLRPWWPLPECTTTAMAKWVHLSGSYQ